MATAEEIVVKLTAQNGELNAGMAEAATTVKTSTDAMAASCQNAIAAFGQFENIQRGSIGTAQEAAAAQEAINAAQASGAFTAEEIAEKQALVSAAMSKVGQETEAASGALSMFTRNSRTMYSTSALITDAMTGQFSRMRREVAALANETGVMATAFRLIASPIGVGALAVAGFGVAMVEAADRYGRFEQTILSTGDIIGMTAGQLQTMADDVGNLTGASFDAVDAVNKIGQSGLFTGEQLRTASEAAVYFSQVTGENMNKAASVIEQLQDKPKEAIVKLNDQYHFLTENQAELIVKLLNTGQSAQAAAVAVQAFHDAMADRAQQMLDNTSALARDWQAVKEWTEQSTEAVAEYLNMLGGSKDITDQLNRAYIQLANDQSGLFKLAHPFSSQADAIKQDMAAIDQLRNKEAQQEAQAQKTAAANKAAADALDHGLHGGKHGSGSDMSELEEQFREQEAARHASYDQMRVDGADYWNAEANNAKNSTAVQAEAWQKYVQYRNQLDEQSLRQDEEATRKGEEAAKQSAEARARAERQASQEIVQEIKEEAAAKLAADVQAVDNTHAIATARVHAAIEGYKDEEAAGKITAKQLLDDQESALKQQLAADIAYYQARARLAAGQPAEVAKWNAAIIQDKIKTNAELLALDKQYQAQLARIQKEIADEKMRDDQRVIMSGFREVNALIGRQETFKQAMQNIGMQILEVEEQNIAKSIAAHFAGEQTKAAATAAGQAEQLAATQAGQAQMLIVQGEAAVKWIITEAAKAAAGAFNALVSIPYVGPFLAVGASVAAFAAVSKLVSSVASAEGGWERVPADGIHTELHRDEMVLPKHVADPVRQAAKAGFSGSGGGSVHIHAMDGISVMRVLKKNPAALKAALSHAGRNGWRR